jgi:hypothetical protein
MVTVPKLFPGETIACLGCGPSLTQDDVNAVRGRARVIAINDAFILAPWADVLYACDQHFWKIHNGVPEFQGLRYSLTAKPGKWPGVQNLKYTMGDGLDLDPSSVKTGRGSGSNSGYQAINVAVHLGAKRILLLGYDMQLGTKGEKNWHKPHDVRPASPYAEFRKSFQSLVQPLKNAGIEVVNCSRRTALTAFPCVPLERALEAVAA